MNPNRPARLNRTVLAVLGLLLLLTGAAVLLVGSGAAPAVAARLPVRADVPMLAAGFAAPAWLPWVGVAASVVVGLAALWWLAAQTARAPATGTWQLADDPRGGTTELDTATAAAPLAEEISTYPGVRAATARLVGAHQHPQVHLRVTAEDGASLPEVRQRIDEVAVPRLIGALDLTALDADLVLRLTGR
jgi:hypothetical protein